jgi:hypothetical protein
LTEGLELDPLTLPSSLVCPDTYVKVQLMLNRRKWKKKATSVKKGTVSPYFNEAFTFLVPFSQIQVGSWIKAGEWGRT